MKIIKATFLAILLIMVTTKVVFVSSNSNRVLGVSDNVTLVKSMKITNQKEAIIPSYVIVSAVAFAVLHTSVSSWATNQPTSKNIGDKNQSFYFID